MLEFIGVTGSLARTIEKLRVQKNQSVRRYESPIRDVRASRIIAEDLLKPHETRACKWGETKIGRKRLPKVVPWLVGLGVAYAVLLPIIL